MAASAAKKDTKKKSSGGGGGEGGDDGEGEKNEPTDDMPDKGSATDENDDKEAQKAGVPEISEEELAKMNEAADGKTSKDFNSRFDTSEDFSSEQFEAVKHKGKAYEFKIRRYGTVSIFNVLSPDPILISNRLLNYLSQKLDNL